jgi:hypothetical protein
MSTTKAGLSSLLSRLLLNLAILLFSGALASANPVIYKAGNPSKGKKIVFVASDHEYRAEETLPALARILAVHHGFDCTVLFGLNGNGEIEGRGFKHSRTGSIKRCGWYGYLSLVSSLFRSSK